MGFFIESKRNKKKKVFTLFTALYLIYFIAAIFVWVGYYIEGYQYPILYSDAALGGAVFGVFLLCIEMFRGGISRSSFLGNCLNLLFIILGFGLLFLIIEPLEQARYEEIIDNASKCLNNEKEYC